MSTAHTRLLDALTGAGCKVTNGGRASTCPAHDDRAPSLSIGPRHDGDGVVINCHAGCTPEAVTGALGMVPADLFDAPRKAGDKPVQVARYDYVDEQGTVLFEKLRYEPKTFRQRAADGSWSLQGVRRVLYRLPDVLEAIQDSRTIYLAEGEKDAGALAAAGRTSTCWTEGAWQPGTAPKWREEYTEQLVGAHVVIVRDRDDAGRHTAETIAATLEPVAASVRIMEPTVGKDVSDHLAAGLSVDDLEPVDRQAGVTPVPPDLEVSELGSSWAALDLAETVAGVIAGTVTRPAPTIGRRNDGQALFYRGKVNGVAGASNAGKSWTGFYSCSQEIAAGDHVVYIDLEDDMAAAVTRLIDLGVPAETIVARFHYVSPSETYTSEAAAHLDALLDRVHPSLVIIDSTGESMALDGAKPNDDDDVARWFRRLPTAIARRSGAAVVVLDHVTKAEDGGLWPIGSQRKRAAIGGAQYMQVNVKPFDRTTAGFSKLVCAKDRHGNYHQGQTVALVHVTPTGDGVDLELRVPAEAGSSGVGQWRPTGLMERIARALEGEAEALSFRGIDEKVSGKADHKRTALRALVDDGHVQVTDGPRNAKLHRLVRPYLQRDDPASDLYEGRDTLAPLNASESTVECVRVLGRDTGHTHSDRVPDTVGTQSGHGGESTCGHHECDAPPRPGKVMCALHFTREPVTK